MVWYFRTHQPHKEVKIHIVYEDGTRPYTRQGLYVLLTYVEHTLTDSPEGTFMTEKSGDPIGYGDHSFLAARLNRRNKRVMDKLIAYIEGHKEELHAAYLRHNVRWMSEIIRAFEAPIIDRWEPERGKVDTDTLRRLLEEYPASEEVVALVNGKLRPVDAVQFPSSGQVILILGEEEVE